MELLAVLDEAGVATLVDLDGGQGDALSAELERWRTPDDRVVVFAGLDYAHWATDPAFGETESQRLRDSAARGARGLKVWKLLGLRAIDPTGRLVAVDDPRLDPLWATAAELDLPVLIHIADPVAFFEPLDATNERWEELRENPDWHFWPTRPADVPAIRTRAGFPPFDELLAAFGRLVARHPRTTFVGAHVGCAAEDLGLVGRLLDAQPEPVDRHRRPARGARSPAVQHARVHAPVRRPDPVRRRPRPGSGDLPAPLPVPRDLRRVVRLRGRGGAEPGALADPRHRPAG